VPVLTSIHVAQGRRLPMRSVERATVEAGKGIVGDRYHGTRHRHVSVQSAAALRAATEAFGADVPAELTRRNLTVDDGAVPTVPGSLIRIGDVMLEVVRVAAPCKLLDDTIGRGAQEALRRRGGSICRVLVGAEIAVGDLVDLDADPALRDTVAPITPLPPHARLP